MYKSLRGRDSLMDLGKLQVVQETQRSRSKEAVIDQAGKEIKDPNSLKLKKKT